EPQRGDGGGRARLPNNTLRPPPPRPPPPPHLVFFPPHPPFARGGGAVAEATRRDRSRARGLGLKSAGPRRAASCGIKRLPCEQFRQRSPVRHNPRIGLHNPVMLPYRLWPPLRFAGKG